MTLLAVYQNSVGYELLGERAYEFGTKNHQIVVFMIESGINPHQCHLMIVDGDKLQRILKARYKEAGSQRAWAKQHKLDESLVSRVVNGDRDFTDDILKALKAKRVGQYKVPEI
jgi:hypothetical protein